MGQTKSGYILDDSGASPYSERAKKDTKKKPAATAKRKTAKKPVAKARKK